MSRPKASGEVWKCPQCGRTVELFVKPSEPPVCWAHGMGKSYRMEPDKKRR